METDINQNEALHKEVMSELLQLYVGKEPVGQDLFHVCVIGSGNEFIRNTLNGRLIKFKKISKVKSIGANIPDEKIRYTLMQFALELTRAIVELSGEEGTKECFVKNMYDELHNLYIKKNTDYGDSFHQTYLEEGFAMARIRLSDKINRFDTLSKTKDLKGMVSDESIIDTLMDALNYSVMTVMEIDRDGKKSAE
jgi:hypothetical protein